MYYRTKINQKLTILTIKYNILQTLYINPGPELTLYDRFSTRCCYSWHYGLIGALWKVSEMLIQPPVNNHNNLRWVFCCTVHPQQLSYASVFHHQPSVVCSSLCWRYYYYYYSSLLIASARAVK